MSESCRAMTRQGAGCREFRGLKADGYGWLYCPRHLKRRAVRS